VDGSGENGAQELGEDQALVTELFQGGADIAGASVGAAIGLVGGPPGALGGAAAGAVAGRVLSRVGADLQRRFLGPREGVRVGAAAAFAAAEIEAQLESGNQIRQDGFFGEDDAGRAPADEVLEGVLLKARDAYQEKKVRHIGILFGRVAFEPGVSPASANQLIELASQLTYRQLVLMAILISEADRQSMRKGDYRDDPKAIAALGLNGRSALTEAYDLYRRGLITDAKGVAWISVADVNPAQSQLQGSGAVLAQLIGLDQVSDTDRQEVIGLLSE
jgi:hypothetical protein